MRQAQAAAMVQDQMPKALQVTDFKIHILGHNTKYVLDIRHYYSPPSTILEIAKYKEVYLTVTAEANKIDAALGERFHERAMEYTPTVETFAAPSPAFKCPKCNSDMVVKRQKNDADKYYITCMSYPKCKNVVWLPTVVKTIDVLPDSCASCGPNYKNLKFEWRNNSISHLYPPPYIGCIGGCDVTFLELLNINICNIKNVSGNTRAQSTQSNVVTSSNNRSNNVQTNVRQNIPNQPRQFVPPPTVNRAQNATNTGPRIPAANTMDHRMPTPSPSENGDENNVMCGCNKPAILLTVRRQTANYGKKFYKCPVGADNGGCDFFLWAPESGEAVRNHFETPSSSPSFTGGTSGWATGSATGSSFPTNSPDDDVTCHCGLPCKKITVQKEGPNKGRPFYGCTKDMSSRCNFFQWADSEANTEWRGGGGRGGRGGRGGSGGRGGGGGGERGAGARRCGLCRREGHTRNRCPDAAA